MLRSFAERCALDQDDKDLANIVFIVFDEVFTDQKYEQFIEFQAHYACASSHGFVDQTKVHRDHAIAMINGWILYSVIMPLYTLMGLTNNLYL